MLMWKHSHNNRNTQTNYTDTWCEGTANLQSAASIAHYAHNTQNCSCVQVTIMYLVPPVVIGLLNHPKLSDYDLSHLRLITCGAAPLGKETEAQCVRKLGVPCLQGMYCFDVVCLGVIFVFSFM